MRSQPSRPARWLWALAVLLGTSASSWAVSPNAYDALIQRARAGDYDPALTMLRERGGQYPRDRRAAYDHMIIAEWAGKTSETIAVYEALQPAPDSLPAPVLSALARAYRDTRRWSEALARYREGRQRFPGNSSFALGEVMVLADSGRADEAIRLGKDLVSRGPSDPGPRLALAYAYRRANTPYAALYEADRAHALAPRNSEATREYVFALQDAGLAQEALRLARQYPALFKPAELRQLQGDCAAELVRLASMPTRQESERFALADQALALYDRLVADWGALGAAAHDDFVRVRIDRLVALHARMRMAELVREYEAMHAEGVQVPTYALDDVAAAYLYLHKPEAAGVLYRRIAADTHVPDDPYLRLNNQTGSFYASLESESFDEADRTIQTARNEHARWRYLKGQPDRLPNDLKLQAEQTAAMGLFFSEDTAGAQQRMEKLVAQAPNNTGLRAALATVYRGRQQPRRAERELKTAETMDPRNLQVEVEQGFTALSLQEWRQAEALSRDASARMPDDQAARRLEHEWRIHNKAELQVHGYHGNASDSPVAGSREFGIETIMYSAPIHYDWRAFGAAGYATAKFEEGDADYRWLRAGVQWRGRDASVEVEASTHNYGYGVKPGMRVSGTFDLGDHWQIGASGELRSRDTPLRALENNISSNSLEAFVRWRANERREWQLALSPSHFSDGNNRYTAVLTGRERLYTAPRLKADFGLELSTTRNSKQDVPYFSPRSDLTVLPDLSLTHVLYRRYNTVVEQKFTLGAGTYTQQDHGTGAIGLAAYGLRYRTGDVFEIGATVTGITRPYDGVREREIRVLLDLTLRF